MAVVRVDNQFQILSPDTKLEAVRITDIILDPSHDRFEDFGNYDSIGTVFYTKLNQSNPSTDSIARPLFSFVKNYPLINEVVLIMSSGDKDNKISTYYFPLVNIWNHPHHNALPYVEDIQSTTNDYEQSIARQVEDGSTGIELGTYFSESLDIRPLLPYEGDTIIEGRFGNSIRFGSTNISNKVGTPNEWSNVGKLSDPITIIRNGQSDNLEKKGWIHAKEDIMGDASSIYMTSNQQLSNFTPSSLNQKSFGANLVEVLTIQEQLTGDYITPETSITQPEQTTEDITEDTVESFETTPPPAPQESESDDPFADYAEEILDNVGIMELSDVSGTDTIEEEEDGDTNNGGIIVDINTLNYNQNIISKVNNTYYVNLHTPLSSTDLTKQIAPQPTSNRVKYLVVHCTAGNQADTHLDVAHFFMQTRENVGWKRHGYHITIDAYGKCVQIYKDQGGDEIVSNGVGPINSYPATSNQSQNVGNSNTININWIGATPAGILDMSQQQAQAIKEIVTFYVTRYPNIKVLGHNQICTKACPVFNVKKYCELIGITNNNIYQLTEVSRNLNTEFGTNHKSVANITDLKHYS
jgi:N-acetylmuramoyl-L-alanine amidase